MSIAAIEEIVEQVKKLSATDRRKLLTRLNKPQSKPKTNGKKGYVSPDTIWMRENSQKYRGRYVAIKDGQYVADGRTIKEADLAAKEKGIDRPLLAYISGENEEVWGGW